MAEPLNWLTIWHSVSVDRAERHGEADLFGDELDLDLAEADLADEGMVAAVAALGRVAERQQKAFVAAREILQAQIAVRREGQRLAGEVADAGAVLGLRRGLDQPVAPRMSVTRGVGAVAASATAGASGTTPWPSEGSSRRWV